MSIHAIHKKTENFRDTMGTGHGCVFNAIMSSAKFTPQHLHAPVANMGSSPHSISSHHIPADPPAPPCPLLPLLLSLSFLSTSPPSSPLIKLFPKLLRLLARDGVNLVGPASSVMSTSNSCLLDPIGIPDVVVATKGTPAVGSCGSVGLNVDCGGCTAVEDSARCDERTGE